MNSILFGMNQKLKIKAKPSVSDRKQKYGGLKNVFKK